MEKEYGDMSSITVMFDDLSEEEQTKRKEELEALEHVKSVVYLQDDETYQKDNHSKYMLNISANTYSEEARNVLENIDFAVGALLQMGLSMDYSIMLMNRYNQENPKHIAEYIEWLEEREDVNSVQDYSNTIGKSYTYKELAEDMDITSSQAKMLYQMYKDNQNKSDYEKITMYDLICYMDEHVAGNPAYAEFTDKDVKDVRNMLKIRRMSMLNVEQDTMTLEEFLRFITDEILPDETYSAAIDEDMRAEIEDGETQIRENRDLMLGEKYNRMIISTKYPSEGAATFACMGQLLKKADQFENEVYLIGDSAMGYEMDEGFTDELNFVTILTVIAIFIVVMLTFRSIVSSAVLVAVIQAAVFITTAIVALQGYSTNYVALILVQCILMGQPLTMESCCLTTTGK